MNPRIILKQPQRNTMYGSVAPALVKKPTGLIQMVKVFLILVVSPYVEVGNLKVAPEMARGIAVRGVGAGWIHAAICEPAHAVVGGEVFWVRA